jgi:hypothetical protein
MVEDSEVDGAESFFVQEAKSKEAKQKIPKRFFRSTDRDRQIFIFISPVP